MSSFGKEARIKCEEKVQKQLKKVRVALKSWDKVRVENATITV